MKKIMTHLVCGYPSLEESKEIFLVLGKYSSYIELQFPFSDPIADGPLISKANDISLKNGITTDTCFLFLKDNISKVGSKVLIMTYYNLVYNYGVENFIKKAKEVGVYGFIIPDIPYDEYEGKELIALCDKYNIQLVHTVSPSTPKSRLDSIASFSGELLYAISKNMTTGNNFDYSENFKNYIFFFRYSFTSSLI